MSGKLYIVATPIGNLSDISERAKATLTSVDVVLCEDTRVTGNLLSKTLYESSKGSTRPKLLSFHQHSDNKKISEVINRLKIGEDFALVTDAGTPGISDPGGMLVEAVTNQLPDTKIIPIPGPSAVVTALSVSGFPTDKFLFLGFPPQKKGRQAYFNRVNDSRETVAFYESTHRIEKTLTQLGEIINDRPVMVARELTKLHETLYRGTVKEVTEQLLSGSIKGEFVIVVRAK